MCVRVSGLTTLKDTATPVIIDNDAGIRPTTNVKSSKPCILGYIKDKLNEITSVHGPDTQLGVLGPGERGQLLFRAQIEEKAMEAQYSIVQSDNGIIRVSFFFVLFV
jgi:hypothetical protein